MDRPKVNNRNKLYRGLMPAVRDERLDYRLEGMVSSTRIRLYCWNAVQRRQMSSSRS